MLLSIIIPVYNVEKYLDTCVKSVLKQPFADFEVLLVDDGSTDGSSLMCDSYLKKDSRVRVFHKPNGGLSDARNYGIKFAKGDYLLFLDSDDCLADGSLQQIAASIKKHHGVDFLIGDLINSDGTSYSLKSKACIDSEYTGIDYYSAFNSSILKCAVASIYKNDFFEINNISFIKGRYHEDNDFTPRAYYYAKRVVYTGINFYVRNIRDDSITTHKDKRKNLIDIKYISIGLISFAKDSKNKKFIKVLMNNICSSYLSMFSEANIYQYKPLNRKQFIDKRMAITTAKSFKNYMKALLFCISPRLYVRINRLFRKA